MAYSNLLQIITYPWSFRNNSTHRSFGSVPFTPSSSYVVLLLVFILLVVVGLPLFFIIVVVIGYDDDLECNELAAIDEEAGDTGREEGGLMIIIL